MQAHVLTRSFDHFQTTQALLKYKTVVPAVGLTQSGVSIFYYQ